MSAAASYYGTGITIPKPDFRGLTGSPLLPTDPVLVLNAPALASASVVTVRFTASKNNVGSGASLGMLLGLPDGTGGYTDLCFMDGYNGARGLAMNTYNSGFSRGEDLTLFDAGTPASFVARFYANQQQSKFSLFIASRKQTAMSFDPQTTPQTARLFTSTIKLGDTDGIRFDGTLYRADFWFYELPDAACRQLSH